MTLVALPARKKDKITTYPPRPRGRPKTGFKQEVAKLIDDRYMHIAPSEKCYHPDLYMRNDKWKPAHKIFACVAFMVTGSIQEAELYTGIPKATISSWKNQSTWWPVVREQVLAFGGEQLDHTFTHILDMATARLQERLEAGDEVLNSKTGEKTTLAVKALDLAKISDTINKNRALNRGDPTSRTETINRTEQEKLSDLQKNFQKFANAKEIDGEIVDD